MADLSLPARDSVEAQRELFRRASSEEQMPIAAIAKRSGIAATTLKGWSTGTAMPAWAIGALGAAGVPDHLLSLVTEPWNRCVITEEGGDGDLDTAAIDAQHFASSLSAACHPASPGGTAIVPQEVAAIVPLKQRATSSLRRASR